ncbi:glycosyltransferase family 1 protein [Bacillus sp. ISL-35]|uniref:glycosyltransferase family 1 protein n=1 Tax=Bacillus sp. ISL-35 TaxID=2819122 RepID=UPI001BEBD70F|nr:glycosyltransferase family 1 protein [Bacillus sp. ISL-35]MBT2704866.1 glycosyltransferase family 1 protein [Chryseobacterium sp. ISL-80]
MGSPLRVLHVVVNMNRGGAETLLMNLYRNIDRSKIQFDFLTCKEGVFDEEIKQLGGIVYRIPYITDVGHFKYRKNLEEFFNSHLDYKIVHSHLDKMSGLVLQAAKKARIPVRISHSHNTSSEGNLAAKLYKWYIGQLINPNATNYYACSQIAGEWLFNGRSTSASILKNGIDIKEYKYSHQTRREVRAEMQILDNQIVFGHVGRFAYQKNHKFLIEVFAEYCKSNNDSILLLIGDGPLREEIEKKAFDLKIHNKVKFLGVRSDIPRILQALDLFIFPSLHEGLPVSLIEAQGAELPCFISEQISKEVDMGMGLVEFLPLNNKRVWVEEIKKRGSFTNRGKLNLDPIIQKGYNIKNTASKLEEFYLSV